MKLGWAAVTDEGKVRTQNQDRVLADDPLFAVADGMGGHAAGEVAAEIAIETLRQAFAAEPTTEGLVRAFQLAHNAIWERSQNEPDTRGMGTTLTAAALVNQDGEWLLELANVGDSRGYLLRDGDLEQITDDHSLVGDLLRSGRLSAEDAIDHPQRHIVTRAVGIVDGPGTDLAVDTFAIIPYKGDRVLLASDGLSDMLTDDQIASVLRRLADPNDAARELLRMANAAGGNDNISVVLVDVIDDDGKAATASKALANEPAPASAPNVESPTDTGTRQLPPLNPPRRRAIARPRPPRMTIRVVGFIVAVIAVLAFAVVAITWYARGSYFVGLSDRDNVTIFRGRPGGFLWVKPTVTRRYSLTVDQVPAARQPRLREGQAEPTLRAAQHYITNLQDEALKLSQATSTTTPGEPTTVVAPTTAP